MGAGCAIVHHLTAFLQVGVAIAIAVIVATKLYHVDFEVNIDSQVTDVSTSCTLGNDYNNQSLCVYVFVVVGISLAVSLVISLVQCVTCHLCGLGSILDTLFATAGTVWWIVAASIVTKNTQGVSLPDDDYRTAVMAMSWAEAGLFALLLVSGIARACS